MKRILVAFAVAGALLPAACSGASSSDDGTASDDVRTIEVDALDSLAFDPSSIEVSSGETVRFVVTNAGTLPHEFIVGDAAMQMDHERQMGEMDQGSMGGDPLAALSLDPGETEEAEVTFNEPGEILFGCHIPGHYDGGMVGSITVS